MAFLLSSRLMKSDLMKPRTCSSLLSSTSSIVMMEQRAGAKFKYFPDRDLDPPKSTENVVMPDRPRLPIMPKTPLFWSHGGIKPPRQTKEMWRMRGEELVNTELKLGQFGIVALHGGMLKHEHFETMRMGFGRQAKLKDKLFAIYGVDAPYKPITHHGVGKRMGGGKGSISEYGTPVKAGRVVLEVGGDVLWQEVQPWLAKIAQKLPFKALAVNATMLDELRAEEARLVQTNKNPMTFEYLVRNNMFDCQRQLSLYDKIWFGKFVYLDRQMNIKWKWVTKERYKGKK
eukprot:TRINITY_DN80302_c0_g1_i1.p1 TRINITY_DN80302_c0_g1~~TRINITY_DN80302_c0_g1_i1.p1  ORF type:complete len:287 (+),score=54.22 TRINITY_DN80302_c0_g1_i1:48-908(+)